MVTEETMIKFRYNFDSYASAGTIAFVSILLVLAAVVINLGVFALFGLLLSLIWNAAHLVPNSHLVWWQGSLIAIGLYLCGRLLGIGRKND